MKVCTGSGIAMMVAAGLLALGLSYGLPAMTGTAGALGRDLLIVVIPVAAGMLVYSAGLYHYKIEEFQLVMRRASSLVGGLRALV